MSTKTQSIPLGFEVGTGEPVSIPLKHMCITGQTQDSGKTTTLEALITRSGLRAIAFITKRGETSFDTGTAILPFFQERADWEFVESVMEATMNEKKKFERSWTVKACRGAHSLADVQRNCQELGAKARRSMDQDLFMLLNEYLSKVVPLLAGLPVNPRLVLQSGLNVMDLTMYPLEIQSLVISSSIRWIHKHEDNVITIIPEAWKFCPQGRKTPVYVEVKNLAREGAGLKNYIWIDSQDIAGVEKEILRGVAVWLLGVQREAHEIERALASIPKGIKRPKEGEIPGLQIGQFFTCFGDQVRKVYVQPAWLDPTRARGIAIGAIKVVEKPARKEQAMDYKALYEEERKKTSQLEIQIAEMRRDLELMKQGVPVSKVVMAPDVQLPPVTPGKEVTYNGEMPKHFEDFYVLLKQRLMAEAPTLLVALSHTVPQIEVTLTREKLKWNTTSAIGKVCYAIARGEMKAGKFPAEIADILCAAGLPIDANNVGAALRDLAQRGFVRKQTNGRYIAIEEMKVHLIEA